MTCHSSAATDYSTHGFCVTAANMFYMENMISVSEPGDVVASCNHVFAKNGRPGTTPISDLSFVPFAAYRVMHLSMLYPTTPHPREVGAR